MDEGGGRWLLLQCLFTAQSVKVEAVNLDIVISRPFFFWLRVLICVQYQSTCNERAINGYRYR